MKSSPALRPMRARNSTGIGREVVDDSPAARNGNTGAGLMCGNSGRNTRPAGILDAAIRFVSTMTFRRPACPIRKTYPGPDDASDRSVNTLDRVPSSLSRKSPMREVSTGGSVQARARLGCMPVQTG